MAVNPQTFETLTPSRYTTFTFPNPTTSTTTLLRVAVLDSPTPSTDSPRIAAMLVPPHLDSDWIFSTESGHLQLLLNSPGISRLILIGNHNYTNKRKLLEDNLIPLLIALSPKGYVKNGFIDIPFLSYEDNVIDNVVLEQCVGPCVGEMLIEDVEIESSHKREFRRRLRFKRMPNLVQTEIRVVPKREEEIGCESVVGNESVGFCLDLGVLVHPYLGPMVTSLVLIGGYVEERRKQGFRPRALCVGVGGGALLSFLTMQLGFEVEGVEADEEVLRVARRYFGLEESEYFRVCVGNGIEEIEKLARVCDGLHWKSLDAHDVENDCCLGENDSFGGKYDVLMVDLDANDSKHGIMAPPLEFIQESVLINAKMVLHRFGILVTNVIPPDRSFYDMLIHKFHKVFHNLYEIDVGNGENFVLIASMSAVETTFGKSENSFLTKLEQLNFGGYIDSIRKI